MMQLIERAAYRSMPWKNGLGSTTQIAVHPAHATADDFCWRISMAVVNTDGPFSLFPGADRTLAVLEGAGIGLAFPDGKTAWLTCGSAPFGFAADIPTGCTLIHGPILDLNVMTRRHAFSHRVQACAGPAEWGGPDGTIVLFAHDAPLRIDDGVQQLRVAPGNSAICDGAAQGVKIVPETSGNYYLIEFTEIQSPG